LEIEIFQFQWTIEDLAEFPKKVAFEIDDSDHSSMLNLCGEHDSCQTILVMSTFTVDSTPTSLIYSFYKVPAHIVENYHYRSS
jgi:hypothetical protein